MVKSMKYDVIGLMSGTSLDGLDIAFCSFTFKDNLWKFKINEAETIAYDLKWSKRLASLEHASGLDLMVAHSDYGTYLGKQTASFINKHKIKPDFVSSHGHTIFHQPHKGISTQIGHGASIAAACKVPVVCDFRSLDVAMGGQGAPLVPVGDQRLFGNYDYCLNLGGFANVSYQYKGKRIAFDVCPINIVLNELSLNLGKKFDDEGLLARNGSVNKKLLDKLNAIAYYKQLPPKSLGKEWVLKAISPLLESSSCSEKDLLCTYTEHCAQQLSDVFTKNIGKRTSVKKNISVLITGGGAYNKFLIERFELLSGMKFILPEKSIIEYKEALIFAFLGVLRWVNSKNCLSSVTGATIDTSGGCIYMV